MLVFANWVWIFGKFDTGSLFNILLSEETQTRPVDRLSPHQEFLGVYLRGPNSGGSNLFQDAAAAWRSMKRFNVRNAISRIRRFLFYFFSFAVTNLLLVTLFIVARCEQMGP